MWNIVKLRRNVKWRIKCEMCGAFWFYAYERKWWGWKKLAETKGATIEASESRLADYLITQRVLREVHDYDERMQPVGWIPRKR